MRARTAIWLRSCSDRLVRCGSIRFRYLLHFFIIFTVLFVKCRSGNWWVLLTKMHILKNMLLSIKNKSSTEWTAIDCVGHRTHTRMCMCVCECLGCVRYADTSISLWIFVETLDRSSKHPQNWTHTAAVVSRCRSSSCEKRTIEVLFRRRKKIIFKIIFFFDYFLLFSLF